MGPHTKRTEGPELGTSIPSPLLGRDLGPVRIPGHFFFFQVLLHYHVPVSGLLNLLCPQVSALSPSPEPGVLSPQAWASACIVLPGCSSADRPPCLSPHFLVIVQPSLVGLRTCLALRASHKPALVLELSLHEECHYPHSSDEEMGAGENKTQRKASLNPLLQELVRHPGKHLTSSHGCEKARPF